MKVIKAKRVKGKGLSSKNGYPTVNVQFELDTLEEGLWSCYLCVGTGWSRYEYKSIASVSEYSGALCTEIHTVDRLQTPIIVDEEVKILFIKKLRDKLSNINPIEQIKIDIDLLNNTPLKSCEDCSRYYSQDRGYSNYTVESTDYGCYADIFDETSLTSGKYNANGCDHFKEGDMWVLDVDGEEPKPSEGWLKAVMRDVKLNSILKK